MLQCPVIPLAETSSIPTRVVRTFDSIFSTHTKRMQSNTTSHFHVVYLLSEDSITKN